MLKRAVSPLIATVLLVMIVVSIGAAVMVVIQGLSEEQIQNIETQQDLLKCGTEVEVSLLKIDNNYRMCKTVNSTAVGNFTLYMENTGQKDITGFKVIVYGDQGFGSRTYSDTLTKGTTKILSFQFTGAATNNSELSRIEINPQLAGRETVTCKEPNLQFDEELIDSLEDCGFVSWDNSATTATIVS